MISLSKIEDKFEEIVQIAPIRPSEAYDLGKSFLNDVELGYFEKAIIQAAIAFSGQFLGYYSESFYLAKESLKIFEEKQHLKYQAFVYNTLGFIYNYLNDLNNRLKVNLKSLELRKIIGDTDGYMRSLNNTGDTYCRLGQYSKALDYFNACLEITPEDNLRMLAVVTCNLGEVHYLLGNVDQSQLFLERSENFARAIDFKGILYTIYLYQAKIKMVDEKYLEAIQILDREIINVDYEKEIEDVAPLFKELAFCYEKIGNSQQALSNFKLYYSLQERINAEKYDSEIRRIQFSYEIKNLQTQKDQLEALVYERTVELENAFTELQAKDKTNEAILESATDGVILINSDGKIEKANRIFCEKFNFNSTDNRKIYEFLEFVDGSNFENFVAELIANPEKITSKPFYVKSKEIDTSTSFFRANFNQINEQNKNLGLIFLSDITYQLQIEEERKEELEAEKTINIFSQSLFNENTVDGVLWSLTKNCIAHLGFYECIVYLVDSENNYLIQKAAHGPKNPSDRHISNPIKIKIGDGIVGTVAVTGKQEKIGDTSKDPRYIIDDEIRYSEIAVPIFSNNEVIGIIDSEHPKANFFTDRHLRILNTVSQLVANRIDKLKEQEAKERLQEALVVLNANLEQEIKNKTKENTELVRIVFEQEQKAIFGELTKSVAHELNTPIAVIKSGVEAITEQISEACHGFTSTELTHEDLHFIRKTASKGNIPTHRYGLEESKKIMVIAPIVEELFNNKTAHQDLAYWLLKTQLISRIEIEEVAKLNSPLFTLKLLFNIQQIFGFSNSVVQSIDNVIKVVNEIKSIHHQDDLENKSNIQIRDLMSTILENELNLKFNLNWYNGIKGNAIIFGQESKIKQMLTLLLQFIVAHAQFKPDAEINIQSETLSNSTSLKFDFPVLSIDSILEENINYSSQHSTNTAEKLRLNLMLTILQEHNAALKFHLFEHVFSTTINFQGRLN